MTAAAPEGAMLRHKVWGRVNMRRRDGRPLWVDEGGATVVALERVDLRSPGTTRYDEAWLQSLLHRRPEVFPVGQIEKGFGPLIPLCREFSVTFGAGRSGALDNLYATPDGGLVLVEAKLWRNPEARRSVVAQAMEYAAAIFRLSYSEFEAAVLRARQGQAPAASLFEIVSAHSGAADEAEFVDAVSLNLSRGRAIIAVVGDGIREDIAPLAELLQSHAGNRFTFALVELAVYRAPADGALLIVPSVLAQTTLIERGVVRIEVGTAGRVVVEDPPEARNSGGRPSRAFGIGEDEFFDNLGARDPSWPALLKTFLEKAEGIGVYVDRQGGLNLKHSSPEGRPLNLATITKDGFIDTGPSTWWGRRPVGEVYNQRLAASIGGFVRPMKDEAESVVRTAAGKTPRISDFLPAHEQAWLEAMQAYILAMFEREESGATEG